MPVYPMIVKVCTHVLKSETIQSYVCVNHACKRTVHIRVCFAYVQLRLCVYCCLSILGSYLISPWVMWQDKVTVCQKAGHGAVTVEASLCARVPGIIRHSLPYQSITNNHSGCFLSGICPSGHQLREKDRFFLAAEVIIFPVFLPPSPHYDCYW